jgi:hypothetical protein
MDYVTRQFINLTKKFRKELPKLVKAIQDNLAQNTESIRASDKRREQEQSVQPLWLDPVLAKHDESERNRTTSDDRQYRVQNWIRWAAWSTFLAASVYAGITAYYASITRHQLKEMQTQTRIQRNAAINQERAWIGLDETLKIDVLEIMPRLKVESHYSIKNFGHGPALKVMPSGWFWSDPKTLGNLAKSACDGAVAFATGTVPHTPDVTMPGPMGYTLFPDQSHTETIGSPNDPWQGDGEPNLKHFWFIGCVAYLDQFKIIHWTRFCVEPDLFPRPMDKRIPLKFCSLYNDTDESPPKPE